MPLIHRSGPAQGWMLTALACALPGLAQEAPSPAGRPAQTSGASAPLAAPAAPSCSQVVVDPPTRVTLGKSQVLRLPEPVVRLLVGGTPAGRTVAPAAEAHAGAASAPSPGGGSGAARAAAGAADEGVAQVDITLLSPTELFVLGRKPGSMNLVMQTADGRCFVRDLRVSVDPDTLQAQLAELMPAETAIRVRSMDSALVLTGEVSDAMQLEQALGLARSLGEGRRVVNMMRVAAPQQVMLEVKIAEVSKTLLDRFGIDYSRVLATATGGAVISGIFGGTPGVLGRFGGGNLDFRGTASGAVGNMLGSAAGAAATPQLPSGAAARPGSASVVGIDAQNRDGLIRVLAEPNIMAISGQSASFLSGGKIFIPVAQNREFGGAQSTTLEEKEFGVGLKFTPTVLDGTRVNLKLTSEVSDLSQTGSAFTTVGGVTSVLPSITTRRVDTTVQLGDGQSFAIAGLIKNNSTQSISRFPGLGELPILGTLFRSTEYQKDQTELVFVITPRLVRPLRTAAALPTDVHVAPARTEAWLGGQAEGRRPPPVSPVPAAPPAPAPRAADPPKPPSPLQAEPAPAQSVVDGGDALPAQASTPDLHEESRP